MHADWCALFGGEGDMNDAKWLLRSFALTVNVILLLAIAADLPLFASGDEWSVFEVRQTYDGRPFSFEWRPLATFVDYQIYALRFPSPVITALDANNVVPAQLYLPRRNTQAGPVPAVICLHILSGNRELMELVCSALASRGVAGMTFPLPYYGERGPTAGPKGLLSDPNSLIQAVHQAWADIRRAVDLLASRPEIDSQRISLLGISFGGIVAIGAAAEEPRFWRILPILAGGDLPKIIQHAPEAQALREAWAQMPPEKREQLVNLLQSVDPLRYADKLRPKAQAGRVWMINAAQDEVIPRECTERLAQAMGISEQVWWLEGVGHYTSITKLPDLVDRTVAFFAQDIGEEVVQTGTEWKEHLSAEERLSTLLSEISKVVLGEPEGELGYRVELEGKVKNGTETIFQLRYIRGAKGKFFLSADLPAVGRVTIGQHEVPWMASGKAVVFVGNPALKGPTTGLPIEDIQQETACKQTDSPENPGSRAAEAAIPKNGLCEQDPLRFAEPRYRDQVRMTAGILAAVALAPQLLQRQGVSVRQNRVVDGVELQVQLPPSLGRGEMKVLFSPEVSSPRKCQLAIAGWETELNILTWQINKPVDPRTFFPPEAASVREVSCYEIHRIFGALFNFAMASLEGRDSVP